MKKFDEECAALKRRLIEMGHLGETMIRRAVEALVNRDTVAIKDVRAKEKVMDRMQVEIDDTAIRLITIYSPVASDLRFLLMASRACSDLERIGDLARNMGKYVKLLVAQPELKPPEDLARMADLVCTILHDAIVAFDERDAKKATETRLLDEQVDDLDDKIFKDLVGYIGDDPNLTRTVALVLLSRALERIADHATNICEDVVYLVEAKDIRHQN
jgi:phosphate transport system protein